MFKIDEELTIHITRGDSGRFAFSAIAEDGNNDSGDDETTEAEGSAESVTLHQFQTGNVIRFKVMEKKGCDNVVMSKDFIVESPTYNVNISLNREDTRIGEVISKPKDYWYEIELNPETVPRTVIGYDEDGPKVFRLYPEGGDTI